jgi:hypothetical protein
MIMIVAMAFASTDKSTKPAKKEKVLFKPGADVTFEFFFVVPPGFHLGEEPLAAVSFDKKKIEKLPITVKPLEYSWTREDLAPEVTKKGHDQTTMAAKVPVKIGSKCATGELAIPASVDVFYCNIEEGWCTSSHYDTKLKVNVSDDKKALSKGTLKVTVVVTPEV